MESATNLFFSITELVNHLALFLDHKELSRLMQTSRHLNELFTSAFYYNTMTAFQFDKHKVFSSKDATRALARNTHHIRQLTLRTTEAVYCANCIMAYQDEVLCQATTDATVKDHLPQQQFLQAQRPLWLAPPDPRNRDMLPVPPITMLTKLEIHSEFASVTKRCPYLLPSFKDLKATLTHFCWIMDLNPNLLEVNLDRIIIKDQRDLRLLTASISGLKSLQRLCIEIYHHNNWETSFDLTSTLFFSFPESIQSLDLCLVQEDSHWEEELHDEYFNMSQGEPHSWEKDEAECGIPAIIPRRQEPLLYLTNFNITDSRATGVSENALTSILAHCPNLTRIGLSLMMEIWDVDHFAEKIAQLCPNLSSVRAVEAYENKAQRLTVRLLGALSEQQVKAFDCTSHNHIKDPDLVDLQWSFRRHSSTLQSIVIAGCLNFDSRTIQVILGQCRALEKFSISWDYIYAQQLFIELGDIAEFPWGCTRIKELELNVAIPDEPFHHLEEDMVPYYDRPAPIALTAVEREQFKSLETFYCQIGALTELHTLNLRAIFYDPEDRRPATQKYLLNTFPGMLSLGCEETGRPGFLHHLSGLTKLKRLWGSVSLKAAEHKTTIGTREIEWKKQHWPILDDPLF